MFALVIPLLLQAAAPLQIASYPRENRRESERGLSVSLHEEAMRPAYRFGRVEISTFVGNKVLLPSLEMQWWEFCFKNDC